MTTRIAVLLSGSGRTLANFLERMADGSMPGTIVDVTEGNQPLVIALPGAPNLL